VLDKFYMDRCPQCGSIVTNEDVLTRDPYKPAKTGRHEGRESAPKKFQFDQKGGSETEQGSGSLKSKPIDPTFGIKGRI
jgi:hypothetical protein